MTRRSQQHDLAASAGRRLDPWVEQQRRDAAFRAARRRRRTIRGVVGGAVVGVGVIVALVVTSGSGSGESSGSVPVDTAPATEPAVPTSSSQAPSTVSPEELIGVEEIWLIDRGDRIYDWGVVVLTPPGAPPRSGVDVEVRLIAADDTVVDTVRVGLDGIDDLAPGVAAGRLVEPEVSPVRLEFDVAVGTASDRTAVGELVDLRALDRSDDRLTGRIRAAGPDTVEDFGILFVWRGDDGQVVAAVPLAVDRVRPGVDARFEVDLTDEPVPDGLPATTFWTS